MQVFQVLGYNHDIRLDHNAYNLKKQTFFSQCGIILCFKFGFLIVEDGTKNLHHQKKQFKNLKFILNTFNEFLYL